jgi:16S rRNA (guanine966-N2)-methyltransferase
VLKKLHLSKKNFEHFDKLKGYVKKLNVIEDISIINKDVLAWLDETNDEFDLIFVDPPFYEQLAEKVLLKIKTKSLLAKSGNIYLEVEKDLDLSFLEMDWEVIKETNSGRKQYLLLKEK